MAAIAALALLATVVLAERALASASTMLVRGEAEAMAARLVGELRGADVPEDGLEAALERLHDEGVRYVAIGERGGSTREAGTRTIEGPTRPGEFTSKGDRARIVVPFPKGDPGPPHEGVEGKRPPPGAPGGPPPSAGNRPGPIGDGAPPRPDGPGEPRFHHLVVELEPRVPHALRSDLFRITLVGGLASVALVAFAIAWSRSLRRLEALQREAEQNSRLVALGRMSSVMAHELRNPLASLKGHAQLLAETLEDDAASSAKAGLVVREAERLETLTKSLLEFVRDGAPRRERVTPAALLEDALRDVPATATTVDVAGVSALSVDRARVARALHNLVENAVQASDGERVEIRVRAEGADAIIEVRDRGPGLPSEPIFEPFVTTRVKGTGLGLPIARRIAEQHGGTLTAANHPDGGALFRLTLPDARATS